MKTILLINGHGGVINNIYQTAGKRSPKWHKGFLYEGMFNRWVVNRLIEKLDRARIPFVNIVPEYKDISLKERVRRVNTFLRDNKSEAFVLEIHANAGGGKGIEVFTSKGKTKSDELAENLITSFEESKINRIRYDLSDGDKDKEANFFTIRKTKCPHLLIECGFMDNKIDYENLWSEKYIKDLVDVLFNFILKNYL